MIDTSNSDTAADESIKCCGIICWRRKPRISQSADIYNTAARQTGQTKMLIDEYTNIEIPSDEQTAIFTGDLPYPLNVGQCVEISGKPNNDCNRFSVNFQCDREPDSDIALHFNPRLDMKYIVRNSRLNGNWDKEETVSPYKFGFPRNKPFKLLFFIAPKEFMVAINDEHFCTFAYRIPLTKIRFLCINGDVTIEQVVFEEKQRYPDVKSTGETFNIPFEDSFREDEILPNPFIGHLPKGLKPGWQVEIYGKVKLLPHSFYINFQDSTKYWPHPIIPIHLNQRFNTSLDSHSLIRNTWMNGAWGQEEITNGSVFCPSKKFRLSIQIENDKFLVWVDGMLQGEFKFRESLKYVNTVYIQGDLYLHKVFVLQSFTNMLLDIY